MHGVVVVVVYCRWRALNVDDPLELEEYTPAVAEDPERRRKLLPRAITSR